MKSQEKAVESGKYRIPVFSLVAWSGTGKTSFLEQLIPCLRDLGLTAAVVKHDGHDEFAMDREGTDSDRLRKAGAEITAVFSDRRGAVLYHRPVSPEEFVEQIQGVDLILTEGFKKEKWPKILLYRRGCGKWPADPALGGDEASLPDGGFAADPDRCIAVVTDTKIDTKTRQFSPGEAEQLARFLYERIRGNR